ncbi:uncharacterized protein KQ657_000802 [Scheffersomyces spartinae]|uniref:SET domain-containing protein n=1 Tax=Scheffersomyces spartinae TaxID=45513 RepID=A0A9P7V8Y0_9ASCO|nr:uncharacterized protein KQ657_000802 [Scheffersomyces spartinae]KAG7193384.1 hypothetical protein KQ657_000802 [Scheffersomyces spartinae]
MSLESLILWIEDANGSAISCGLQVKEDPATGRGIYIGSDFLKSSLNQPLITIPHGLLVNRHTVLQTITKNSDDKSCPENEIYASHSKDWWNSLSSVRMVLTFLLVEKAKGPNSFYAPFIDMLPDIKDFELSPLFWHIQNEQELIKSLPSQTAVLTSKIIKRFEEDFEFTLTNFKFQPEKILKLEYFWAWMSINSRCLYMNLDDRIHANNWTLCPFVDFINHSPSESCTNRVDPVKGFQVIVPNGFLVMPEDQIFFNYGPHLNDFLLVEYGFTSLLNKWNDLHLDSAILPLISPEQVEFLKENDYYENYTIDSNGELSFRTQVVFALVSQGDWHTNTGKRKLSLFMQGYTEFSQFNVKPIVKKVLGKVRNDIKHKIRWRQDSDARKRVIGELCTQMDHIASITLTAIELEQ